MVYHFKNCKDSARVFIIGVVLCILQGILDIFKFIGLSFIYFIVLHYTLH